MRQPLPFDENKFFKNVKLEDIKKTPDGTILDFVLKLLCFIQIK